MKLPIVFRLLVIDGLCQQRRAPTPKWFGCSIPQIYPQARNDEKVCLRWMCRCLFSETYLPSHIWIFRPRFWSFANELRWLALAVAQTPRISWGGPYVCSRKLRGPPLRPSKIGGSLPSPWFRHPAPLALDLFCKSLFHSLDQILAGSSFPQIMFNCFQCGFYFPAMKALHALDYKHGPKT